MPKRFENAFSLRDKQLGLPRGLHARCILLEEAMILLNRSRVLSCSCRKKGMIEKKRQLAKEIYLVTEARQRLNLFCVVRFDDKGDVFI